MMAYNFSQLIDFTRTSSGTFTDSTGKIASTPASRNLLTFTQEFDNAAWLKTAATITANSTTAPDGTSTADTYTESNATSFRVVQAPNLPFTSGLSYTISVYAKQGPGTRVLQLYPSFATGGNSGAAFNLTNGTVVSTAGTGSGVGSITSVGDGWYRCSFTFVAQVTGTNSIFIGMAATTAAAMNASYAGNGTSGIFIWGAQLELGSTATTYTRNFGGVFPPRFDYDPVTLAPKGLLIEEQRSNLLTYSEQFDNAAWLKSATTVTANAASSPDGTTTSDKAIVNNGTALGAASAAGVRQVITKAASAITYTYTVFAKAAEFNSIVLFIANSAATSSGRCQFNLAAGTASATTTVGSFTGVSASIANAGGGWYRCSITATSDTATDLRGDVWPTDTVATTGNGTSGVLIWGAQLEAGAFATSYIPTVASQVTRTPDQTTMDGANFANWYNQTQGTFVTSVDCPALGGRAEMSVDDGSTANALRMISQVANPFFVARVAAANVAVLDGGTITANTPYTQANAYAVNNYGVSVNGEAAVTSASGAVPTVNRMTIGWDSFGNHLNGHVRSIQYYPTRLSDAQLAVLSA